jgi:hypothetical protein
LLVAAPHARHWARNRTSKLFKGRGVELIAAGNGGAQKRPAGRRSAGKSAVIAFVDFIEVFADL